MGAAEHPQDILINYEGALSTIHYNNSHGEITVLPSLACQYLFGHHINTCMHTMHPVRMNAKISARERETASTFIHDLNNIPTQTNPELMVIKQKRRFVRRGASAWINPRTAPKNHLIAVGNYK